MQTSFPDLPFTNYGKAELRPSGSRITAKPTSRTYPRTDLKTLTSWTSFPHDIHQAIRFATARAHLHSTPFSINAWTDTSFVENEEKLRAHAIFALHAPVQKVLEILGVNGWFTLPGGGNIAIVGDPDFSWIMSDTQPHPKVIVEYKTWWAADLVVAAFNGTPGDTLSRQSLHALEHIYGYMTSNNNKFGILTNWQRALFLRRAETSDRKTLEYHTIELDGPDQPISMLKAWVGMVLLAEDDWFYVSPTISSVPPGRNFGTSTTAWKERKGAVVDAQEYRMLPVDGDYQCLALDFRLCRFDLSSARHGANGCVVNARLLAPFVGKRDLQVVCKVVDVLRYPDAAKLLDDEAHAYAALQNLQGQVIPTLYGFYEVWGILKLLALQPVGNAILEDELIDQTLREKMKAALRRIHDAGYVHGDVARRNFCRTDSGDIFLVDLERCQRSENPSELDNEMNEVDGL
ncbi:hypothetical protein PILCRDRAFT_69679 [Piloderma croceum F 1598]|uniref:Protein kinase domain-containing protein n=1 Tax=Piloderma croceum (strain F 1598) TaxID=765440 RepID=A0A0C3FG84_PILCF|nr:hypothetical protein PILCRDRAFT_69679 [Piloderma croceum F 1598]